MPRWKTYSILPGFPLTFGVTVIYLAVMVLLPLTMLFVKAASMDPAHFWKVLTAARTLAAFRLSFAAAGLSAGVNAFFGLLVAWVLVRYDFPAKKFINALIDLPFALPTAVAGIALTALYAPDGWIGRGLAAGGIQAAYAPLGIVVALVFVGLPFVVRSVEPVLEEMDSEVEEAAHSLGANRLQIFCRIIFPTLFPALLTGAAMAFARALGEYGSVVFISGNMPLKTEVLPLLIMTKLEQYDYQGATAIAVVTLAISFVLLLGVNFLQAWSRKGRSLA